MYCPPGNRALPPVLSAGVACGYYLYSPTGYEHQQHSPEGATYYSTGREPCVSVSLYNYEFCKDDIKGQPLLCRPFRASWL